MAWHGYIHYQEIGDGLGGNRSLARAFARSMGRQRTRRAHHNNHFTRNGDGTELIVEAQYDNSELTRAAIYGGLARALGTTQANVQTLVSATVLGGRSATWEESRVLAAAIVGGW